MDFMKQIRSSTLVKVCHFTLFAVSIGVWWQSEYPTYHDAIYMLVASMYVALVNLPRREILPAMLILILAYSLNWAVTYSLYDTNKWMQLALFGFLTAFNLALSYLLFKYHCAPKIQQLLQVTFCRKFIPQVLAMCMICAMAAFANFCVMLEIAAYIFAPGLFDSVGKDGPFFYSNVATVMAVLNCLMLLAIWSMMLDAHYLKARLDQHKNSMTL